MVNLKFSPQVSAPGVLSYAKNLLLGRSDDLVTSRFWVEVDRELVAAFRECSGLNAEIDVYSYAEGGRNEFEHKLLGRTKHSNVTLRSGVANAAYLWTWFNEVSLAVSSGDLPRRNVSIILYTQSTDEAVRWNLDGAYPVRWEGPSLKSDENSAAVQALELVHRGLGMVRRA